MKIPNVDVKKTLNNGYEAVKTGAKNAYSKVKPSLTAGIKYTKNLAKDTFQFAKKNPVKTGLFAGAAVLLAGVVTGFVKAVKANKTKSEIIHVQRKLIEHQNKAIGNLEEANDVKDEHIAHQRDIIDGLKDEVENRQEIIDTLHDAVDVATQKKKMNNKSL